MKVAAKKILILVGAMTFLTLLFNNQMLPNTGGMTGIETQFLNQNLSSGELPVVVNDPYAKPDPIVTPKVVNRLSTHFITMGSANIIKAPPSFQFPGFGMNDPEILWNTPSAVAFSKDDKTIYAFLNSSKTAGSTESNLLTLVVENMFNWLPGFPNLKPKLILDGEPDTGFFLFQAEVNMPVVSTVNDGNIYLQLWFTMRQFNPDGSQLNSDQQVLLPISINLMHTVPAGVQRVFNDYVDAVKDTSNNGTRFYTSHALPQSTDHMRNITLHNYSGQLMQSKSFGWKTYSFTISKAQLRNIIQRISGFTKGKKTSYTENDLNRMAVSQVSLYMETERTLNNVDPQAKKAMLSAGVRNMLVAYIPGSWIPRYLGYINGLLFQQGNGPVVDGWACAKDIGLPVQVQVIATSPTSGETVTLGLVQANQRRNAEDLSSSQYCNTNTPHHWSLTLSPYQLTQYKGWIVSARLRQIEPNGTVFNLNNFKKGVFEIP